MLQLNVQGKTGNEGKNINVHKMYDNLSADIGSHILCHIWARKSNEKVMSLTLKVISFFGPTLASKTFFRKTKVLYHNKKKDIMPWNIFRFFWLKSQYVITVISHTTSVNGENQCYFFLVSFFKIGRHCCRVFLTKKARFIFLQKLFKIWCDL